MKQKLTNTTPAKKLRSFFSAARCATLIASTARTHNSHTCSRTPRQIVCTRVCVCVSVNKTRKYFCIIHITQTHRQWTRRFASMMRMIRPRDCICDLDNNSTLHPLSTATHTPPPPSRYRSIETTCWWWVARPHHVSFRLLLHHTEWDMDMDSVNIVILFLHPSVPQHDTCIAKNRANF